MAKEGRFLNDDVFFDVLSLLPAKILVGLRRVSKTWRDLISDRSFIRAQLLRAEPESPSGFVVQHKYRWGNGDDIKYATYVHIGGDGGGFRILRGAFDFLPDDVVAMSSCGGLFCCRSCFPADEPFVFVCNPAGRAWAALPWPGLDRRARLALAFDPLPAEFALVGVLEERDEEATWFAFEVYSSRTGAWRRSAEVCGSGESLSRGRGVAYAGGVAYWLADGGGRVLSFAVEAELSWEVSVPEFNAAPLVSCIGESEGKLHYVTVSEGGLTLWGLGGGWAESVWALEQCVPLEELERKHPRWFYRLREKVAVSPTGDVPWVNPLGFHGGLLLMRVGADIYIYCFATGQARHVCEVDDLGATSVFYPTVLPCSVTLVPPLVP